MDSLLGQGHNPVRLTDRRDDMTIHTESRLLSSDELDLVSGGEKAVVCTKTGGFSFLGYDFTFGNCSDGKDHAFVTQGNVIIHNA